MNQDLFVARRKMHKRFRDVKDLQFIHSNFPSDLDLASQLLSTREVININTDAPKKIVVFLHSSIVYNSGGYATRAHGILRAAVAQGFGVKAYMRPNYPHDLGSQYKQIDSNVPHCVDGVDYFHSPRVNCSRLKDESGYMLETMRVFFDIIAYEQPDVVHGRSTYLISLPALIASKRNKIPFLYETSGLWELVFESRDEEGNRQRAARIRVLESLVARNADYNLTLTGAMQSELRARGVMDCEIDLAPNAVDLDLHCAENISSDGLKESLCINDDSLVIGYIGSMQDYEGLDDLIAALEKIMGRGISNFVLLLVGDGPFYNSIKQLVSASSIREKVIDIGRVPYSEVKRYYNIIDICCYPRKPWVVCEAVSPMKPLEAFAYGKAVIMSDVGALTEIAAGGAVARLFEKGNTESLVVSILSLWNPLDRAKLGSSAKDWVRKNRSWSAIFEKFRSAYAKITSGDQFYSSQN